MKLLGIGDLFVPGEYVAKGFAPLEKRGVVVETIEWDVGDFDALQNHHLKVEQDGCDSVGVPKEILKAVADADIAVGHFFPMNTEFIEVAKKLKVLGVLRGGYENVNVETATRQSVLVCNTPGRNAHSVADFTVGCILAEARNIARGHHGLKHGKWIRAYPNSGNIPDLPGRTVGLIGFGEIGRQVARRFQGFDMRVLAFDPFVSKEQLAEAGAESATLEELLEQSDFVSLHARLTAENRHLINAAVLARMKPTAYLVNTARAGLVDEEALYEALKEKEIAGASLDVFEKEPPGEDYPLVTLENVTLTPHMAGGSNDAFLNSPVLLCAAMESLFEEGGTCCFAVNPEVQKPGVLKQA